MRKRNIVGAAMQHSNVDTVKFLVENLQKCTIDGSFFNISFFFKIHLNACMLSYSQLFNSKVL